MLRYIFDIHFNTFENCARIYKLQKSNQNSYTKTLRYELIDIPRFKIPVRQTKIFSTYFYAIGWTGTKNLSILLRAKIFVCLEAHSYVKCL